MKAEGNHFQTAKSDFQILKKSNEIPPQMQVKLEYLLSKVENRQVSGQVLQSLPEYEKNSLDQLNKETGIHLFCNIVNCLSGKEIVLYFRDEKAYLRKDQMFSMWKDCYITCDSKNVSIKKKSGEKIIQNFQIVNLKISKNFKLYKRKHVFGVNYDRKKNYLIGFDYESSCSRIHQLLRSLIRQKSRNAIKAANYENSQLSVSKCIENNKSYQMVQSRVVEHQQPADQQQQDEEVGEETDKGVVIEFIKQEQLNGTSMYNVTQVQGNVRQMIHKNYPNKFRTEIVLPKPKTKTSIFDNYIKLNQWNPEIEQCKIKIKASENSYILEVRVRRYSYISWARSTVLLVTALMYKNSMFLVIRSTGDDCQYSDTVKMEWNQIIEVCESQDKCLVSVTSEMDFSGFCSLEDSQRMGLKVLDFQKFVKYHEAKEISSKGMPLFNLTSTNKIFKKQAQFETETASELRASTDTKIRKLSNNSEFDMPDDESRDSVSLSGQKQSQESNLKFQSEKIEQDPQNFTMFMLRNDNSEVNLQLIDQIRKKTHERYYLRQKFDLEVHLDPSRAQHSVVEPNHYIYQNANWKVNEDQDLVFINQKIIELQKDIIKMILKQIGSNLLSGKSIMNMSLPVEVFDHRSILERIAMGFGYAPKYLIPASETEDILEQMRLVTLFFLTVAPMHLSISKPFNPILGQTFQCLIGGIPLSFQQISHHPPISALYMSTENMAFYGNFHSHAEMGLNRVTGKNLMPLFLKFPKTNTFYEIKLPEMEISGTMHGDRKYRSIGKGFIHERTNNLYTQWSIAKDKKKVYQAEGKLKTNDLIGGIFTVSPGFGKKFIQCENKLKFDGVKPDDIIETHVKITGHWCFDIYFNGSKVKSTQNPIPNKIEYPPYVLPSDSNFRLDLIYKRLEQLKTSNEQKQVLEQIQRHDRKLRQGKIRAQ